MLATEFFELNNALIMNKTERPIIFLDIDGVLNHELFALSRSSQKIELDAASVDRVNQLADKCDFVISSTWRSDGLDEVTNTLRNYGFKGNVIDITPFCKCGVRGVEIREWLYKNRDSNFTSYAILDDDSDMLLEQAPNFFHCDPYIGVTHNTIYKIKRFLKID